jgi:hypothetical protein
MWLRGDTLKHSVIIGVIVLVSSRAVLASAQEPVSGDSLAERLAEEVDSRSRVRIQTDGDYVQLHDPELRDGALVYSQATPESLGEELPRPLLLADVQELQVPRSQALLGAVVGAVAGGIAGYLLGNTLEEVEENSSSDGDARVALTTGGVLFGGFIGNSIGRLLVRWTVVYPTSGK